MEINAIKLKRLLTNSLELENFHLTEHLEDALTNLALNKDSIQILLNQHRFRGETQLLQVVNKLTAENMNYQKEVEKLKRECQKSRAHALIHQQIMEEYLLRDKEAQKELDDRVFHLQTQLRAKQRTIQELEFKLRDQVENAVSVEVISKNLVPPTLNNKGLGNKLLEVEARHARAADEIQLLYKQNDELQEENKTLKRELKKYNTLIQRIVHHCEKGAAQEEEEQQDETEEEQEEYEYEGYEEEEEKQSSIIKDESLLLDGSSALRNQLAQMDFDDSSMGHDVDILSPLESPLPIKVELTNTHDMKKSQVPTLDLGRVKNRYPPLFKGEVLNISKIEKKSEMNDHTDENILQALEEETKPKLPVLSSMKQCV